MARPVVGKDYLFVQCKSCGKHFRVVDDPLFEGKAVEIKSTPVLLSCRGCGAQAEYAPTEMKIASIQRQKKSS